MLSPEILNTSLKFSDPGIFHDYTKIDAGLKILRNEENMAFQVCEVYFKKHNSPDIMSV